MIAFCIGLLFLRKKIDWEGWFYISGLSLLYVMSDSVLLSVLDGPTRIIYETGLYAARFVLILQLTHVLLLLRHWVPMREFLRVSGSFGKHSLFVFIFHRPICQLTGVAAGRLTASVELRLFLIAGVTIGVLMATAWARRMIPVLDRTLTTIGF